MRRCMIGLIGLLTVTGTIWLVGCEKKSPDGGESASAMSNEHVAIVIPETVFVDTAPAEPRSLGEVKADLDATGDVVVSGRIGGRREPFVEGAAVFFLADSTMKSCDELHGDTCKTPWDYCCEDPDSLAAKIATIQIVDDAGRPLRTSAEGVHDLKPGARLVIAGEVLPREDTASLVINARQIFVQ